ncbi:MAG: aromatic ring-hydroxylating dioxygenase subunit alpha [Alphaproteobacteria bacterium]|nr:MAG: aromatic ring-hydroxylating dioxygenase subunit alpha [Alphaproteobacteria bacterium]
MPGAFYSAPELFDWETRTVLRQGWHCLGRADEIPQPGDFITAQLLDEPLLAVRGEDGAIRVFANICRHRGMPLAEGRGRARRFVCSYHAWAFGLDGALLRAARMRNADFDPKSCRLHEFACKERFGFIYVSVADSPPSLDAQLAGLPELLAPYETEDFRLVHVAEETWGANWKCLVENFMEGYHLSVVHPQTLHGYTPTGLSRKLGAGPGWTAYAANYPQSAPPRGKGAPGLSPQERHRSTLFAVFPTQVVSQAASLLVSLSIFPEAVDRMRVKWTMSVYGEDLDEETIAQRIALWNEVNREDREKLERLQLSLRSPHAFAGPLAEDDLEGTIRDFHRWLARQDGEKAPRARAVG